MYQLELIYLISFRIFVSKLDKTKIIYLRTFIKGKLQNMYSGQVTLNFPKD